MGTVSYIPTAFTLAADFSSAMHYLKETDPVSLIMMPEDRKQEFVQDTLGLFLGKIDHTHRFHDLMTDAARANIRLLIGIAEKRRDAGYSDEKLRDYWCRDVMSSMRSLMQLATSPSDAIAARKRELAL